MKHLLIFTIILASTPTFAGVSEHSPVKVLINDETGQVIFMPRESDYSFELAKADKQAAAVEAAKIHIPSLKEILLGKGKCSKRS